MTVKSLLLFFSLRTSAGGRKGDPVLKWEAGVVQEVGRALGARTGEGECPNPVPFYKTTKPIHPDGSVE